MAQQKYKVVDYLSARGIGNRTEVAIGQLQLYVTIFVEAIYLLRRNVKVAYPVSRLDIFFVLQNLRLLGISGSKAITASPDPYHE